MRLNYDYYNAEELLRIIYDDLDTGETDKKKFGWLGCCAEETDENIIKMIMTLRKLLSINYDDFDTGETDENKLGWLWCWGIWRE